MGMGIDIRKLCNLTKLEIPEQDMAAISEKLKEVLLMFDKLDEFTTEGSEDNGIEDLKLERAYENLRNDEPRPPLRSSETSPTKIRLKNNKDGFVLGPRI
jgi:aspartyl/glutamyl-tRNA(Asn/Gln) amidotransferase C subunit